MVYKYMFKYLWSDDIIKYYNKKGSLDNLVGFYIPDVNFHLDLLFKYTKIYITDSCDVLRSIYYSIMITQLKINDKIINIKLCNKNKIFNIRYFSIDNYNIYINLIKRNNLDNKNMKKIEITYYKTEPLYKIYL